MPTFSIIVRTMVPSLYDLHVVLMQSLSVPALIDFSLCCFAVNTQGLAQDALEREKLLWKLRPKLHKCLARNTNLMFLLLTSDYKATRATSVALSGCYLD